MVCNAMFPALLLSVCHPGNGDCSPKKTENSRMLVDLSANTPNGQQFQHPNSPTGEWLLNIYVHTNTHTYVWTQRGTHTRTHTQTQEDYVC